MWISRKKFNQLCEANERMISALQEAEKQMVAFQKHAHLIGIEREGRSLKLTFVRRGKIYILEAMSLMSDNMKEWKENLLS